MDMRARNKRAKANPLKAQPKYKRLAARATTTPKHAKSIAKKTVPAPRQIPGRLLAVTATGPIYEAKTTYNLVPFSCGLALLQELAAKTLKNNAKVVSSLAQRVEGEEAFAAWASRTLSYSASLADANPQARLLVLREVIAYIHRQRSADGIEPILAAAINAAWPWMSFDELHGVLEFASSTIGRTSFTDKVGCIVVDPNTRTYNLLDPGRLKAYDPMEWLRWKKIEAKDWRLGIPKQLPGNGLGGAAPGGMGAGGLFGPDDPGSNNPFGAGGAFSGGHGAGGRNAGLGSDGRDGSGFGGGSQWGGILGGDDPGSGNPFGAGGSFSGGHGAGGQNPHIGGMGNIGGSRPGDGFGGMFGADDPGSNNPFGAGGSFSGGHGAGGGLPGGLGAGFGGRPGSAGGGLPGDASGPFGSLDPRQSGGPTGFGAALGPGGASDFWSNAEEAYGWSLVVRGAVVVATGAVIANPGVMGVGAAAIAVGGIMISDANDKENKQIHEKERQEDKEQQRKQGTRGTAPAKEEKKEEKKDSKSGTNVNDLPNAPGTPVNNLPNAGSKQGDKYPDPHGKGKTLPAGDGDGGGDPTMMPTDDIKGGGKPNTKPVDGKGGGAPNTMPDRDGVGGGDPTTIWDENGGGVTPTTVGMLVSGVMLVGSGLRAARLQVGASTYRF